MDYEKKYKEALEWARKVMQGKIGFVLDEVLEKFPELKESGDIRKRIIDALHGDVLEMGEIKKAIAWLEKQGNLMKALQISNAEIGELIEKNYYLKEQLEKQGELKKHDVCDNCEQQGSCVSPCPMKLVEKQGKQKPVFEMKTPEESLGIDSDTYNKIVDECVYGKQKSAWSEEDENKVTLFMQLVEGCDNYEELSNWLKALRDKYTWKPSDRQMEVLDEVIRNPYLSTAEYNGLIALREQFKEL